ncbi:dockerin type I domain-containing protein [Rhodopirellula sp. JC740]|uniref:Dockerin type I domain-containing protein n=1 Tax=Rhodopirellula halodulae TaxID=2894198 RepID=A0ABS8NH17_9BACT|nr:peroxidase family protein [Rhodopirellula sp. JC740]MCC9642852.1 dockerin type I domain-containing protein [Rhodopirellula sp. JC740]
MESLETRQLLAADGIACRHNVYDAEDVNDDGRVSALDALLVINALSDERSDDASVFTDVTNDGNRSALDALRVINRIGNDHEVTSIPSIGPGPLIPNAPEVVSSIDGRGNNLTHTNWGATGQMLLRIAPAAYADGVSAPAGANRPSPRVISNLLSTNSSDSPINQHGLSAFVYAWGQFIDHDLGLSETEQQGESFGIVVPTGDPHFDPDQTGTKTIPFHRNEFALGTGTSTDNPAQQINLITAFLDGSMVYGSDETTAASLRTFVGGRMRVTSNDLLPLDEHGMAIAGDSRASENIGLTAMHTLFIREHNRLADEIRIIEPAADDETVYQRARAVVTAIVQSITYNEFLPALLGRGFMTAYAGYNSTANPGIATEFSTAAFRLGHSTLREEIGFLDNDGKALQDEVALKDAYFRASMLEETGIDGLLKFDASAAANEIDLGVVDALRNFLFGPPGAGGMDLVAMNIQRGRDHGLSDYNATREAYGLPPVSTFADITGDVTLQNRLASLYGSVDDIDLWVGLMAEDHLLDASVGELTATIIADQFQRTRDGDRFFYRNVWEGQALQTLEQTRLKDVIERNTSAVGLQDNVFFMRTELRGQVYADTSPSSEPNDRRGIEDCLIELMDQDSKVVATTRTDRFGNYRFRSFSLTGDYQVRFVDSGETLTASITNGDSRIRHLDFMLADIDA